MVGSTYTLLQRRRVLVLEIPKIIRAKLENETLTSIESIYKCGPNTTKGQHFGSNCFLIMLVTCSSRQENVVLTVNPQDLTRDNGKIYRLNADGSILRQPICRRGWPAKKLYILTVTVIHKA
jgi:hypothetical protein